MLKNYKRLIKYAPQKTGLIKLRRYLQNLRSRNAVFIWIPKTGGTTIYNQLRNHHCQRYLDVSLVRDEFPSRGIVTFGHISYIKLLEQRMISQQFNRTAFKFCFVRNPYERMVSLFIYLKVIGKIQKYAHFDSFCRSIKLGLFPAVGLYNSQGLSQATPQVEWIQGVDLDFIGKLENFSDDFKVVCEALKIPCSTEFERHNATAHRPYQEYYSKESMSIVREVYAEDFNRFGYDVEMDLQTYRTS